MPQPSDGNGVAVMGPMGRRVEKTPAPPKVLVLVDLAALVRARPGGSSLHPSLPFAPVLPGALVPGPGARALTLARVDPRTLHLFRLILDDLALVGSQPGVGREQAGDGRCDQCSLQCAFHPSILLVRVRPAVNPPTSSSPVRCCQDRSGYTPYVHHTPSGWPLNTGTLAKVPTPWQTSLTGTRSFP